MRGRDADLVLGDIGRRIRELRDAKGWTQAQLAERAGWESAHYVKQLERGSKNPSVRSLVKLAELLAPDEDVAVLLIAPGSRSKRRPGRPKKSQR